MVGGWEYDGIGAECRQEQRIQSGDYLEKRRLCQRLRVRVATRRLLFDNIEELSWGRKYLETFINSSAPQKN